MSLLMDKALCTISISARHVERPCWLIKF